MGARLAATLVAVMLAVAAPGGPAGAAEKVIFDTDFNTMGDDGQAFVMLVQAMREGKVDLLGMTVVSGNQWLDQEVADGLRAVERMGVADKVKVYPGAPYPLLHDQATLALEQGLFGKGYSGAFATPRPKADELTAPPDGFAQGVRAEEKSGVDYLVETIKAHPRDLTILAVGPLTNLALAFRKNPEVVPLVKRIVYMGGAVEVPGNVTPAAEFNWWFDPDAAKIVLRQPGIEHVVVPLDVTNTAMFGKDVYDKIGGAGTPVSRMFAATYAETFEKDAGAKAEVWDTLAAAYVLDPTIATDVREMSLDIDAVFGPDYGRSLGYAKREPVGTQKVKVVFGMDLGRFWGMYTDLLTRPVGGK